MSKTWPMTLTEHRRAVFAKQALGRYEAGERSLRPVVLDAFAQYLAILRHRFARDAAPFLTAAAPQPRPFTKKDAARIYSLMISDPHRWHPILDDTLMAGVNALLGPITDAALNHPQTANAVQAWRSRYLKDRRQILVHIPDAITAQLRTRLDDLAGTEGTNVDDARGEVDTMLSDGYASWSGRAQLIARTETVAANNQGALASWGAMAQAGDLKATKTWLATPDGRTRPEHAEANGQTVGIHDTFTVMGEDVSGPGDGSAANVCNCRCTLTFDIPDNAPQEVKDEASDLEDELAAAAGPPPSPVIYFLEEFDMDAPTDTTTVTAPAAQPADDAPTGVCVMAKLSSADAAKLAQPGGEAADDLHVTLGYLAKDAAEYTDDVKASLGEALASAWTGPVSADVFATSLFNANDEEREPCSVVLVQSAGLAELHAAVSDAIGGLASDTFPIWVPHIALAYNSTEPLPDDLSGGSITLDKLVLAWGPDQTDLTSASLTAATEAPVTAPTKPAAPAPPAAPADDSATGGDTAAPDLTPVGQTWSGPLAELGVPSSDGRIIKAGGGTIRPLPLALAWQKEDDLEHDGAIIVARILTVEDRGDVLWGTGDYLDPMMNFDAEQAMAQVDAGLGTTSVDIIPSSIGFADDDGNPVDPALYDGNPDGCHIVALEWEFAGATIVRVPAFANARITNDPAPEAQPGSVLDMPMPGPETFAGATPQGPVLGEDGKTITLQDGSTVTVGDTVGLGDQDGDGDDDTGTITAIDSEGQAVDVTLLPDGDDDADDDPNNPVKITVPIAQLVPPPSLPTNKPGSAEGAGETAVPGAMSLAVADAGPYEPQPYTKDPDETVQCPSCGKFDSPDAQYCDQCGFKLAGAEGVVVGGDADAGGAMSAQFADEPVSDKPWTDFPESDFNPDQWKRACIIHLDPEPGGDPASKGLHKLPIREPDGTLNRNAVHAAAGRVTGTDAPPDKIASAKATLRGAYGTLGEADSMPDSIKAALMPEDDEDYALLASSYSEPYRAEFFRKQPLTGPTALRLDRETGQISGHLGAFGTCHVAKLAETGQCVTVPTGDDFSSFHVGEVMTDEGLLNVGKITVGGGHMGNGSLRAAVEHYDRTSSIAAPVVAYYDDYGIQVAGQLLHDIEPAKVDQLMTAGQLSGDWRGRPPHQKLIAALAVNQGSFPVWRSPVVGLDAHGEQTSLVAAGVVYPPKPDRPDIQLPSGQRIARDDFETLVASMVEAMDRGRPIAVVGQADELALRRAKTRLRLSALQLKSLGVR